MRHTDSDAQSRLPVALDFVAAEIVSPAGYAVKFGEHAFPSKLVDCGLGLFGGGIFKAVAEHIDTGHLEAPVSPHGFAQSGSLAAEGRLLHHMAGKHQAVILAPFPAVIRKGLGKPLRNVVMVVVADDRYLPIRQFPKQLRQIFHQIFPVSRPEGIRQILTPGKDNIFFFHGEIQGVFMRKLGFIRKNRGNSAAKIPRNGLFIGFIGHFDKAVHGLFAQGIDISLVIVPRVV